MLARMAALSAWRYRHQCATLRQRAAPPPFGETREAHDALLMRLPVSWDERGYLTCYPDVAAEVLAGNLPSGYAHWLRRGYAERRALPFRPPGADQDRPPRASLAPFWHEAAYLQRNPHVGVLLALGLYNDGLAHYWAVRHHQTPALVPSAAWSEAGYLWLHPDVAEAVQRKQFANGYVHWMAHGLREGRVALPPAGDGPKSAPAAASPGASPSAAAQRFAALAQQMRTLAQI